MVQPLVVYNFQATSADVDSTLKVDNPLEGMKHPPLLLIEHANPINDHKSPKSLIWPGKTALLWAQEAKGISSTASPPNFLFSVPVPHVLHAPLALCSPLILHWTVRMDCLSPHLFGKRKLPMLASFHIRQPRLRQLQHPWRGNDSLT
ncbi:hypothetical protein L2E82_12040 [Cichorium intybus]|uniref:Uncharacterized protein n=1 Tax=Cichorium intybus TaxID=13427 RepID=A0ACB9GEQ4_CICIN|nr:hypothetical protein L2E82_12040 [Cichorium intybus]